MSRACEIINGSKKPSFLTPSPPAISSAIPAPSPCSEFEAGIQPNPVVEIFKFNYLPLQTSVTLVSAFFRCPPANNEFANVLPGFNMHSCLNVDEILRLIAEKLIESESKATAASLACCCRLVHDPVLDTLWETQSQLIPLLKCLPQEVWKEENGKFVS